MKTARLLMPSSARAGAGAASTQNMTAPTRVAWTGAFRPVAISQPSHYSVPPEAAGEEVPATGDIGGAPQEGAGPRAVRAPARRFLEGGLGRGTKPPPSFLAGCGKTRRLLKKVQMQGGARGPHARRTLCTLSVRRGRQVPRRGASPPFRDLPPGFVAPAKPALESGTLLPGRRWHVAQSGPSLTADAWVFRSERELRQRPERGRIRRGPSRPPPRERSRWAFFSSLLIGACGRRAREPGLADGHRHGERGLTGGIVAVMAPFPLALDGVRVIDLSRVIAGPWCGALLADLGADVIKVEDTGSGDESRTWPPHIDEETAAYLLFNRNKRGMTLDLKALEGVEVVKALVRTADVLVENFRTGTMEGFGLGYDVLAEINPRLIYCSVSAFGRTGPRKDSAGYEALMQAFSGIMSITGESGGQPVRSAVSFLDLTTGVLCILGVCAAILQRERTGLGQRVDGSLLETAVSLLAYHAEGYLLAGVVPKALGSGHPSLSPYRNFRCKDGQWIFIAAANDRFWQRLARALGLDGMASDPRFAVNQQRVAHRRELEAMLEELIGGYDREPLLKLLEEADVPATPVNTVDQVMNDPQTIERGIVQRAVHPRLGEIPVVGTPLKFSRMSPGVRRAAPLRGEHTDSILAECGYSAPQISELREKQVIL